jgi:hypothetical protein
VDRSDREFERRGGCRFGDNDDVDAQQFGGGNAAVQQWFPPREYAIGIPAALIAMLLLAVGSLVVLVKIKAAKKKVKSQ